MAVNKFGPLADGRLSPEIGQYYYMVDSNFRTGAQGWSRADGTGPLDLWQAREPGGDTRVYYTPETGNQGTTYASQVASFNAARDAMIDFRGDTLFITPGAYTIGAASTWDVPYATIRGAECRASSRFGCSPRVRNTSITMGVAGGWTCGASADGLEVAYLRFVPTTATACVLVNAAADGMHWHDFLWDAEGVATSASTEMFNFTTAVSKYLQVSNFTWMVDAPQGPVFNVDIGAQFWEISHFLNICALTVGTYVTSLIDYSADGIDGVLLHDGRGFISVAGAGAVTQLLNGAAQTGTSVISVMDFYGGVGYSTATGLIAGTAGDADLSRCFISTTEGGTGETLYTS